MKFQSSFRFKVVTGCICLWTTILLNAAIFTSVIVNSAVKKQIKDTLVMTQDNVDIWGQVPGRYGVKVYRNISLYSIANPDDLRSGKTPLKMVQSEPLIVLEKHTVDGVAF